MKKRNRFISLVLTLGLALSVMATSVSASKFVDAHGNELELDDTLEAYSSVVLSGADNAARKAETNLGDLWTDALRWFAVSGKINAYFDEDDVTAGNTKVEVDADHIVALWNGGNLRADIAADKFGAAELASVFRDARNLTLELCANTSVQSALRQDDAAWQDEEQKIQTARQSSENLTRFFPTFNAEIYGLDAEHQLFGADNIKNISEEWLQAVLHAQGQFVWDYHYTEYGSGVRVSHLIYDEQNWEQPLGIVSVYVNSDYLRYALNSIRLGNNTVVYLLDAKGNLLFPYETGVSIPENVGETVTIAGSASGRSAFVMRRLSVNGFRIVGEARDFDALKEITAQRKTILLLALTALTISVLAALLLTYHISTPILALSNIMKKVGAGDFKVDVPVYKGHDEVAILYSNFKNMLEMRERLTEEVYGAKVREKEAELRTLQAQINPHFLYNTLDSINWMAVKYGADDIEEMVTDLSQMLRYSLNNGVNQLKVSEELTQIRCYLNIQQKRFSNSFSTSYEIDPEVLDYQVIKLLLQPLVENALQHGFDESGQTGKLMLRVKKKENNIEFSVLNNGNKMDLEKVKQALQLPEDAKPTSYGLRNVNDRLVKYYGAESGLQFSIEGDYSCARFTIPAQL